LDAHISGLRVWFVGLLLSVAAAPALAGAPVTNAPDPANGQELASRFCSNCHLVGSGQQEQANADIPSFHEIASKEGQTAGLIMAHIMLPKHPMPTIPLTKKELSDLAAYILSLRERQ
jgi:mono/diheme cytochrome c family protein